MPGPTDLGFQYAQQSNINGIPYEVPRSNGLADIGATLSNAINAIGERQQQQAVAAQAREQATTIRTQRQAAAEIGRLLSERFGHIQVIPNTAVGDENTMAPPLSDEQKLAMEREVATNSMSPSFIAQVLAQRVQAGDGSAAGGDIGDILANLAVSARDADSAAGFRGTPLSAGQSVFESGARATNEFNQAQDTARNDADNATTRRGQDVAAAVSRYATDTNATVDREQIAATDRASRDALEISRATRLDQQTISSAVNNAVGIGRGENVSLPEGFRARIIARTSELLTENQALDPSTAAAMAVDELTDENMHAGAWIPGVGGRRRFNWTEAGRAYRPGATPPVANAPAPNTATPGSLPPGAMVDDETGDVFDAQGRRIGRVNR